ncbi:MAG: D-alanyl-D-alanine carboxypeptidase, partial [Roseovarius sp.]
MLAGGGWAKAPAVSLRPRLRPVGSAAATPLAPARDAEALVEAARLGGDVSYAVLDIATGRMLESREAELGQPPASVTKAVTALY